MRVTVRSERGNVLIEITLTDSISHIKEKIYDKVDYNVTCQRLFFKGELLEDHKQVQNYDIQSESILQLEIEVKLLVKLASTNIDIDCYPSWSIIEVKHAICRNAKLEDNNQTLYLGDTVLNDNKTILEYKLQNDSCLVMTGTLTVTIIFPSGKVVLYPISQSSTVNNMKQTIWGKTRIPIDRQTLNHKGRELREEQTFSSLRYKDGDNVFLVCNQLLTDELQVYVRKPGGERRFISLKKYDPVGMVEDKSGCELENLFSHDCYHNDKLLDDTDVLAACDIQNHSELELKCNGNVVPVFFNSHSITDLIVYLKPTELVSDVIARVRPKLQVDNEHKRLLHRHNNNLNNDQKINDIRVIPGDQLFLGTADSFTITVHLSSLDFMILVCKTDTVRDLMYKIYCKERIPVDIQSLYFNGIHLHLNMNQRISQTNLDCKSIVQLDIQTDTSRFINIKVRDLSGNSKDLKGINPFLTVMTFRQLIHLSHQDTLVHKDIVLNEAKLLCSYGITSGSDILVVSKDPNLFAPPNSYTHSSPKHSAPGYPPQYQDAPHEWQQHQYQQPQPPPQRKQSQPQQHQQLPPQRQQPQQHQQPQPPPQHQQPPPQRQQSQPEQHQHQYQQPQPPLQRQQSQPEQHQHQYQQPQPPLQRQQSQPEQHQHQYQQPQPPPQRQQPHRQPPPQRQQPQQHQQPPPQCQQQPQPQQHQQQQPQPHQHQYQQPPPQRQQPQQHQQPQPQHHHHQQQQQQQQQPDREVKIHFLNNPHRISFHVMCCTSDSVSFLKSKIFEHTKIPTTKIHLIYEGIRLTNNKMKLTEYGISEDTAIQLDDTIYLNVSCRVDHCIYWVNSGDTISTLVAEIAEVMGVWKGDIQLSDKGRRLELHYTFKHYQIQNGCEILAEETH